MNRMCLTQYITVPMVAHELDTPNLCPCLKKQTKLKQNYFYSLFKTVLR